MSIDELPQLINVLLGDMSLVGPRPERPAFVEQFRQSIPRYMDRHREKAGITGWAQVNGLRGDTSIAERTKYDLWYIENWSLLLDIKIVIRTVLQMLQRPERVLGFPIFGFRIFGFAGSSTVIIANGPPPEEATVRCWLRPDDDSTPVRLICADGGARIALALGLTPEVVVGDLDSLDEAAQARLKAMGCRFVVYPAAKDWTDLELALKLAVQEGATEIVILGALGGRLDQELANILLLLLPEVEGVPTRIVDERQEMFVARGQAEIAGQSGDVVSLIPLGGDAEGIVTEGLLYPLRDEPLLSGPARGVSNVMTGPIANVTLRSGALLIVHARV